MAEEAELQSKVLNFLRKKLKVYCVKIISSNEMGTLDIITCINGSFIAIECKSMTGKVTPLQRRTQQRIIRSGGRVFIARPSNWNQLKSQLTHLLTHH